MCFITTRDSPSAPIQLSRDVNRAREMLSNDSAHHCINHNTYVPNTLPAIPPVTALQDSAGLLAVDAEKMINLIIGSKFSCKVVPV